MVFVMANLYHGSRYDRRFQRVLNTHLRSLYEVPQDEVPAYFLELLGRAEEQRTRQQPDQAADTQSLEDRTGSKAP